METFASGVNSDCFRLNFACCLPHWRCLCVKQTFPPKITKPREATRKTTKCTFRVIFGVIVFSTKWVKIQSNYVQRSDKFVILILTSKRQLAAWIHNANIERSIFARYRRLHSNKSQQVLTHVAYFERYFHRMTLSNFCWMFADVGVDGE